MALPPKPIQLNAEDFQDAKDKAAFERLALLLNPSISSVNYALSKRLTVGDNLSAVYKMVTITAPGWTAVTYQNSWLDYDTTVFQAGRYRIKDDGEVVFTGLMKHVANVPVDQVIFNVPENYRPEKMVIHTTSGNGDIFAQARVTTGGDVIMHAGPLTGPTWIDLDGLRYPAYLPNGLPAFTGTGWPITINTGLANRATACLVAQAIDLGGANAMAPAGGVDWRLDSQGNVVVRRVSGLQPGRKYQLTFLIFGG